MSELINKLKEAIKKKKKKKKEVDETVTAKTGDAAHDNDVINKLNKVTNPSAKSALTGAFKSGKAIDL
jgi:hypothetical protein